MRKNRHKHRDVTQAKESRVMNFAFLRGVTFLIKSSTGNYWKACLVCGYSMLWDGGEKNSDPDLFCRHCGRKIIRSKN